MYFKVKFLNFKQKTYFVNMKFSLLYTVLFALLTTYHFILCKDWTHSGEDNDDEENESRERQKAKSFKIPGISLPWVKTSCQNLSTIPKSLLVQINKYLDNDHIIRTPYFCIVKVVKKMKIIDKINAPETANVHFSLHIPQKIKPF